MFRRQEHEVDSSEGTDTESGIMASGDHASIDFFHEKLKTKKIKLLIMVEGDDQYHQDSRIRFCKYYGREFNKSEKTSFDTVSPMNDENQGNCIDLQRDIPSWSQTGKRQRKKTDHGDKIDNIIHSAVPLRVYYGSAVPQIKKRVEDSQEPRMKKKKKKIEEIMPNQYASVELPTTKNISTCVSNESKPSSFHGRLKNPNRAKAVNKTTVHECEICGKRFQTGQALGGHKTCHRIKPVVVPFMGELVQRKGEQELCGGSSGEVREYVTKMLFPEVPSGDHSEETDQQHPKRPRLLDFDLNIPFPYEG